MHHKRFTSGKRHHASHQAKGKGTTGLKHELLQHTQPLQMGIQNGHKEGPKVK